MEKDSFTLKKGEEFIELLKLLKIKSIVQSGGHAKIVIEDGSVKVNGKVEFRKRNKLRVGDKVEVDGMLIEILKNSFALKNNEEQKNNDYSAR